MAFSDWTSTMLQPIVALVLLTLTISRESYADDLETYEMPSETCGGIVSLGDQYKVVSKLVGTPGFDNNTYEANANCYITFRAAENKQFFIRITDFNLEESTQCSTDRLILYDGNMQNNDFIFSTDYGICGPTKSLPNYYYSKTNEVTVKFITDDANTGEEKVNEGNPYQGFVILLTPYIDESQNVTYCEGFRCKLSGACITQDAFCNDVHQCKDASDEPDRCVKAAATSAAISAFLIHITWILGWSLKKIMTISSDGDINF